MNNTLSKIIIFATGAAIGSVVTWKLVKTKYEQIAQEEIDSVKEVFSKRAESIEEVEEPDVNDSYEEIIKNSGYATYSSNKEEKEEVKDVIKPCVIAPEEFGENEDYETVSLTYYSNGVVTDEFDEPIDEESLDDMIGLESLDHFGEYEDDSVFVRNDYSETYYEILADAGEYKEEE